MHQSADDTWLALGVALDKLERVESERDELRALVEHRGRHVLELRAEQRLDLKDVERFRALARGYMDERDELRAELAEWHAHDCRDIANGFPRVERFVPSTAAAMVTPPWEPRGGLSRLCTRCAGLPSQCECAP
jgi:hypothetical protein